MFSTISAPWTVPQGHIDQHSQTHGLHRSQDDSPTQTNSCLFPKESRSRPAVKEIISTELSKLLLVPAYLNYKIYSSYLTYCSMRSRILFYFNLSLSGAILTSLTDYSCKTFLSHYISSLSVREILKSPVSLGNVFFCFTRLILELISSIVASLPYSTQQGQAQTNDPLFKTNSPSFKTSSVEEGESHPYNSQHRPQLKSIGVDPGWVSHTLPFGSTVIYPNGTTSMQASNLLMGKKKNTASQQECSQTVNS